ncbi:DUF5694 domain-containing protein [Allomuricauda sp. SCSIO 65647]|uniref:DUF5694 domain-containing protein n=1 Tax=Allomuricauda sp. SCSIO 65647 TaxID=2908843 RepID=UPI001F3AFF21|nr:DUF5694 domain-containing protein [Muricauda sp. SCSIO 65647]UJH68408.1 DUF5694 domain-containing protein [Muricauda sp. SCSIO 65647]
MRTISFLCMTLLISLVASGQHPDTNTKPKIALLGTFHFGGSTDIAGIVMQEVAGEKRQTEIQQLVDRLKAYEPTKILVEYPLKRQDTLQKRYQDYRSKTFELPLSETYQVGFRLAYQLQHDSIYAIDHKMDMPFEQVLKYCEEHNSMDRFQAIVDYAKSYTAHETEVLKQMQLAPFLRRMNNEASDKEGNGLYLRELLDIGDSENEVGAAVNAVWYQRNMIILKNITQHIQGPDERVLVILGAAHRAILMDFFKNRTEYDIVEIGDYLE